MSGMPSESYSRRLAFLEGIDLEPSDREAIVAEFEDFDRVLAELEAFSEGVPWLAQQAQPPGPDAQHGS